MGYSYKTKIIVILIAGFVWFVFGTMMIIRGSKTSDDLKTISGQSTDYKISEVTRYTNLKKYKIPVLEFQIQSFEKRIGLYLNSRKDYDPIIDKIRDKDKIITITYLDSWGETEEGINMHIYNIDYGKDNLINIDKKTRTDKKVGMILYLVGLIFLSTIFLVKSPENRKKAAANNVYTK